MFQAIKINNYQNLLATKNNRKVTFIINQFQVSICSSTFSPCISPDKTLRIVLSLSINIVFCISPATRFANSFLFLLLLWVFLIIKGYVVPLRAQGIGSRTSECAKTRV